MTSYEKATTAYRLARYEQDDVYYNAHGTFNVPLYWTAWERAAEMWLVAGDAAEEAGADDLASAARLNAQRIYDGLEWARSKDPRRA